MIDLTRPTRFANNFKDLYKEFQLHHKPEDPDDTTDRKNFLDKKYQEYLNTWVEVEFIE